MSLLQQIKATQLQARKSKDAVTASLLTTLIGEASMIGKNDGNRESTDSEVIAVTKKFINNARESIAAITGQIPIDVCFSEASPLWGKLETLNEEVAILNSFLPQQLTADGISQAIDEILVKLSSPTIKDMGKVMKSLKEAYDGRFDGTVASALVKQKLAA